MGRVRIVKMKFDLANEYDAATYRGLGESGQRAFRRSRGMQASYLASLMLGVRRYSGLHGTGLTERPQFAPELDERMEDLRVRIKSLERAVAPARVRKDAHIKVLRLVPPHNSTKPERREG